MASPSTEVDRNPIDSLELVITHLFDAVRYSEESELLQEKAKEVSKEAGEHVSKLQGFVRDVKASLDKLSEEIEEEYARQLAVQVSEFANAAVGQAEARARSDLARKLSDLEARIETERAKAAKSLESYLVASPLPLIEMVLTLKRGESGYVADASYSCKGDIKYKFSLATQNSKFFHSGFTFAPLGKKISIPVALEKTWIRKEASPRYERLERYTLVWAEVTGSHMIADFEDLETQAKVRLVSSAPEGQGNATVEYTEGNRTINVTSDASLNKWLDSKAVADALLGLRAELLSLEQSKAALVELTAGGDDTLKSLNCEYLLSAVLNVMAPSYRAVIRSLAAKPAATKKGEVTMAMLKERMALLGQSSVLVKEALALG